MGRGIPQQQVPEVLGRNDRLDRTESDSRMRSLSQGLAAVVLILIPLAVALLTGSTVLD
jgi:tetrahydromethanopterin S-methyltransferase subunit F